MQNGFVNYWRADIPAGDAELKLTGVCLVELRDGLIARNQVFELQSTAAAPWPCRGWRDPGSPRSTRSGGR
jgi:hypothetical protein